MNFKPLLKATVAVTFLFVFTIYFYYFSKSEDSSSAHVKTQSIGHVEKKIRAPETENYSNVISEIETVENVRLNYTENEYPKSLTLTLPSGLEVALSYKLTDNLNLPLPIRETYDTYISDIIELSDQGVPGAASSAEGLLRQCANAPRTQEAFASHVQYFLETGQFSSKDPSLAGLKVKIGSNAYNQLYQDMQLQYVLCSKVTDRQLEKIDTLHDLAFERGDFAVLSEETLQSFDSDPDRFHEISERSWELGNVGALQSLSLSYQLGIAPSTEGVPDRTTAYAYALAGSIIEGRVLSESQDNVFEIDDIRQSLNVASSTLTLQEQDQATLLAEEIITGNKNCCISVWP